MGLFGFGKKKDVEAGAAGPIGVDASEARIKVLGSGCAKCQALEKATTEALAELGEETRVQHVTDFADIAKYGVMQTPALVIDNKVVSYGKVLSKEEALVLLQNNLSKENLHR